MGPKSPIDIPSLRLKQSMAVDPMAPGEGTPWEDRGNKGAVAAFLATFAGMAARPVALLNSIRRPETLSDANAFVLRCGVFWGLGWCIQRVLSIFVFGQPDPYIDWGKFAVEMVGRLAIGIGGAFAFVRFTAPLVYKLVSSSDMRVKSPQVLTLNLFSYAMAPSLLAIVPYAGAPIAALWVLVLMILGTYHRQQVKLGSAVTCNTLVWLAFVGMALGAYFVGGWLVGDTLSAVDKDMFGY